MIGKAGQNCVQGTPYQTENLNWAYKFQDDPDNFQPVSVRKKKSDQNWLQVWVLFKGDTVYTPSDTGPVQFTPQPNP